MKRNVASENKVIRFQTRLRVGDSVMILSGGNSLKGRALKGQVGKILKFYPKTHRVLVEGQNMVKKHKRPSSATDPGGVVSKEASLHISNVAFYSAEQKSTFSLQVRTLENGKKVRGYINSKTNSFEQIDA